jgi:hypothetical protein
LPVIKKLVDVRLCMVYSGNTNAQSTYCNHDIHQISQPLSTPSDNGAHGWGRI